MPDLTDPLIIKPGPYQVGSSGSTDERGRMVWSWSNGVPPVCVQPDHLPAPVSHAATVRQVQTLLRVLNVSVQDVETLAYLDGREDELTVTADEAFDRLIGDGYTHLDGMHYDAQRHYQALAERVSDNLDARGLITAADDEDDRVIESPSGWKYRASQENGDQVDCVECGDPLNDDLPIVNDVNGYAGHEDCVS